MEIQNNIENLDTNLDWMIDSAELLSGIQELDDVEMNNLVSSLNDDVNSEMEDNLKYLIDYLWENFENWILELTDSDRKNLLTLYKRNEKVWEDNVELENEEECDEISQLLWLCGKTEKVEDKRELTLDDLKENIQKLENWEKLDEEVIFAIKDYIKEQRENSSSADKEKLFKKLEKGIDYWGKSLEEHKESFKKFFIKKVINNIAYNSEEKTNLITEISDYFDKNYKNLDENNSWDFNFEERFAIFNWLVEAIHNVLGWDIEDSIKDIEKDLMYIIDNNFIIENSIDLTFNSLNTTYSSIDNYNPIVDVKADNSDELSNLVKRYRWNLKWRVNVNNRGEVLKNNIEENTKLVEIIKSFYNENKDIIEEKLWITNIHDLTPQQATKLVSLITMSKIDYQHYQALKPNSENSYYKKSSDIEKLEYKKDLLLASYKVIFKEIKNIYKIRNIEDNWLIYWFDNDIEVAKERIMNWKIDLAAISTNEVKQLVKNDILNNYADLFDEQWLLSDVNNIINDIFNIKKWKYWKLDYAYIKQATKEKIYKNDKKSISELLEWWKWVCRNYAVASEKLFEALKVIQNSDNNKLSSSILVYYTWNTEKNNIKSKISDNEFSPAHAWNTLITIWADWKQYVSQIDTTFWDGRWNSKKDEVSKLLWLWEGINIDGLKYLDETFNRLLNDLADKVDEEWFEQLDWELNNYILWLEKTWWDIKNIISLKNKMIKFYEWLWKNEKVNEIENEIKDIDPSKIVAISNKPSELSRNIRDIKGNISEYKVLAMDKFWDSMDFTNFKEVAILMNLVGNEDVDKIINKSFMQNDEFKNWTKEDRLNFINKVALKGWNKWLASRLKNYI